ncbi:MAG: hypothetical protein ACXWUP_12105 [Allosphingosinicella sp.]
MHKLLIAAAAVACAGPALAQPEKPVDPMEEEIRHALPPPGQIEAMAPVIDRSFGALMNLDVGPLLDAADPIRRNPEYGRPGRTLGELGRRDDPYFEQRMRSSIYGTTADMNRMISAFSAATPALVRSMRELERAMDQAMGGYGHSGYDDAPLDDRNE